MQVTPVARGYRAATKLLNNRLIANSLPHLLCSARLSGLFGLTKIAMAAAIARTNSAKVTTFDHETLRNAARQYPDLPTGRSGSPTYNPVAVSRFLQLNSGLFLVLASRRRYHRFLMCDGYEIARRLVGRRAISNRMRRASKFGRKVAVDFESDADFHKCRRCPVHSCLPTFHVCQQLIEIAR
jgi:hypothetical protein